VVALTSLTYTSLARLDLEAADIEAIHRSALHNNALDGITGLLIFNGTHFMQMIEGSEPAIDDLVERLRRDPRHSGFEIRDRRTIEQLNFPDWSMELVRVSAGYFDAKETIAHMIPRGLTGPVRDRILSMTESISRVIEF
jgi:hypothetical protein